MMGARFLALSMMGLTVAGGLWTRHQKTISEGAKPAAEIELTEFGPDVAGTFEDGFIGQKGFEIVVPDCPERIGVLPIPAARSSADPFRFQYRAGAFEIAYAYGDEVFPEAGINYRLGYLKRLYKFEATLGLTHAQPSAFFFKIWEPASCPGVSRQVSPLARKIVEEALRRRS
jgi:hypothetical protein